MQFFGFDDKAFTYHGRWEDRNIVKKSHWVRPYVEFLIEGEFTVLTASGSGGYGVTIDGESVESTDGIFSAPKKSLVRVTASNDTANPLLFYGIASDNAPKAAERRQRTILFIGDSLTHSEFSHSAVLPKAFDADYVCIAQGGMALCSGRGYMNRPDRKGAESMELAFFKLQNPLEKGEMADYDFSTSENPTEIFINLGTNDHLTDESYVAVFEKTYADFVGKVRNIYKNIPIYLLLPVADTEGGYRRNTIEAAAKQCEKLYENVKFISSRAWEVEISDDNVHPTEAGYAAFAEALIKAL